MSKTDFGNPDVIVVGAGNAACCAALAARENGARVIVLEAAPVEDSGGNSRYTGGLMRVVYNNVEDVAQLIPDLTEDEKKTHDYGSYTADAYFDDMGRITQYMSDPDLTEILITKSFDTLVWGICTSLLLARPMRIVSLNGPGRDFFSGIRITNQGHRDPHERRIPKAENLVESSLFPRAYLFQELLVFHTGAKVDTWASTV